MFWFQGDGTANEQTTDELTTSVPFRDDTKENSPEIDLNNEGEFSQNKKDNIKGKDTQPSWLIEHYTSLQYEMDIQKSARDISLNIIVAMLRVYLDDLDDYKQYLKCDYLDKFGACSTDMTCDDWNLDLGAFKICNCVGILQESVYKELLPQSFILLVKHSGSKHWGITKGLIKWLVDVLHGPIAGPVIFPAVVLSVVGNRDGPIV